MLLPSYSPTLRSKLSALSTRLSGQGEKVPRAPERGPRSQTHAQRRNLGISVRPGHPAPAATLPAIPAAAPSGAQDYRWFVRDPLGLTPPGYELAPHTGLDKAPPRTRDEGRLDARATSHWSRIATQPRSCLPGAVTSA